MVTYRASEVHNACLLIYCYSCKKKPTAVLYIQGSIFFK